MQQNTQKQPPQLNQPVFDGMETIHAKGEGGAAAASLDLGTLNTALANSAAYGMTETGSGHGWGWTIKDYRHGQYEVLGVHTEEGMRPPGKKKKKPSKPRAKKREEMTDEDVQRSLNRTKKEVREKTIMIEADKLITLTTREPIVEAEVFKKICSKFFRYCRESAMDLEYVAVFERHMSKKTSYAKYGSLHLHVAVNGYVSYKLLRELWRKAVQWKLKNGDWEGANIDASERKRKGLKGHYGRNSIARYLAKYLTKDMDDEYFEPNKKRFWASKGIERPAKLRVFSPPATHFETFKQMWEDILGLPITKFFMPDRQPGQPPIVWLSTG